MTIETSKLANESFSHPLSMTELQIRLNKTQYLAEPSLITMLYLAYKTGKPLLIEGPPGTGKTSVAKAIASALQRDLIRLQCYEGIDENRILYEWQYSKQILYTNLVKEWRTKQILANLSPQDKQFHEITAINSLKDEVFSQEFLYLRPLTKAILAENPVVLLIDEIDRADAEIEAMMLEILGEGQVTIPELGTLKARSIPLIILTSNRKRRLSEALQRRCLYYYTDHPTIERETKILLKHRPNLPEKLIQKVTKTMHEIRQFEGLSKPPSITESLDFLTLLLELYEEKLTQDLLEKSLGVIFKIREDYQGFKQKALEIIQNQEFEQLNSIQID